MPRSLFCPRDFALAGQILLLIQHLHSKDIGQKKQLPILIFVYLNKQIYKLMNNFGS